MIEVCKMFNVKYILLVMYNAFITIQYLIKITHPYTRDGGAENYFVTVKY